MSVNGSIDTIYELLIFSVMVLAILLLMFKFRGWFESYKPKEKKNKVKKEVVKETIKKVSEVELKDSSKICQDVTIQNENVDKNNNSKQPKVSSSHDNYLYDRFVLTPTAEDSPKNKKNFEGFLTDNEFYNIRDRKVDIHVNKVEESVGYKDALYNRISQMANENIERKEKLLNDFDKLPREIKLILIENIMQNM